MLPVPEVVLAVLAADEESEPLGCCDAGAEPPVVLPEEPVVDDVEFERESVR